MFNRKTESSKNICNYIAAIDGIISFFCHFHSNCNVIPILNKYVFFGIILHGFFIATILEILLKGCLYSVLTKNYTFFKGSFISILR